MTVNTTTKAAAIALANTQAAELVALREQLALLQTVKGQLVEEVAALPVKTITEKMPILLASKEAKYEGGMWLNRAGNIVSYSTKGAVYVEFVSTLAILDNGKQIAIPADRVREFLNVGLVSLKGAWELTPMNDKISAMWAAKEVKFVDVVDEDGPVFNENGYPKRSRENFGAGLRAVYGAVETRATPDFPATIHAHLGRLASLLCRKYVFVAMDLMPKLERTRTDAQGAVVVGTGRLPLPTVIKGQAAIFPVLNYVRERDDDNAIEAWRDDQGRYRNQVTTVAYTPNFVLNNIAIGFGFETDEGLRPESAVGLVTLGEKLFGMTPSMPIAERKSSTIRIKDVSKVMSAVEVEL